MAHVIEKQATFRVCAHSAEEKKKLIKTDMALIRDLRYGMFEVPDSFVKEFEELTGIKIYKNEDISVCRLDITKQDIHNFNATHWIEEQKAL